MSMVSIRPENEHYQLPRFFHSLKCAMAQGLAVHFSDYRLALLARPDLTRGTARSDYCRSQGEPLPVEPNFYATLEISIRQCPSWHPHQGLVPRHTADQRSRSAPCLPLRSSF